MRVDAVCVLMRQSGGLTPKERIAVLSHFEDEEVVAFETVALDTKKYSDVVGYATTSFLEFVHYDFEEFGFFLDNLVESDYYSENNPYYRFKDRIVYVQDRDKLFCVSPTEQVIQMENSYEEQNVTSLHYRKMVDNYVSDFIHQFYQDFVLTMESRSDMTFEAYMKEVEFADRITQFINDNRVDIVKALGEEAGEENVFSRKYSIGVKIRFEKDVLKQLKKRLKQECKEHQFEDIIHRIV